MTSPCRSESFFQDDHSLSILLVPTGEGDSFEVVLGPILTLMRSEEASPEQEGPLAVEPVLIEGGSSHVSSFTDERPLMITGGAVSPESTDSWVEDLTEQAAADYDYELDEGWLEEQLLDNPNVEILVRESPAETHISSGTPRFLCYFIAAFFLLHLHLCFVLQLGPVCLRVLPR
jgi:hypothetical protein